MDARSLFEAAVNAAPETADGAQILGQARDDAETLLTEARVARDAASAEQTRLLVSQAKLNIHLARVNNEVAEAGPSIARDVIAAIDTLGRGSGSVIGKLTDRRRVLLDSAEVLRLALTQLVEVDMVAAGVALLHRKLDYVRASREWIWNDALVRLSALRRAMGPVLEADANATISLDENSLAAQFVRALAERDLEASELEKRAVAAGGLNG